MTSLYERFLDLPDPTPSNNFSAIPLAHGSNDFLAKSSDGAPIFLLFDTGPARYIVGRKLKHFSTEFHATCRVQSGETIVDGQFALVACDSASTELYELFVRCVSAAVEDLPPFRATSELESWVNSLTDLFRALAEPSTRETSGFWAELWVIANSGNPSSAIEMWHEDAFERFDFSAPKTSVEVKSTVRETRSHEFALEQLDPPLGGSGYIISLMLRPITGGVGVLDLAEAIESKLIAASHKAKLWGCINAALGKDFGRSLDKRFDPVFTENRCIIYNMADVPRIQQLVDSRITNVHFTVDLSSVASSLEGTPTANLKTLFGETD
jgi:hypothetical protein